VQRSEELHPILITKCLTDPCSIFYTDTISESILIECKDPRHDPQNHHKTDANTSNQDNNGNIKNVGGKKVTSQIPANKYTDLTTTSSPLGTEVLDRRYDKRQ
jgi:hypothetical protein